MQEKNSSIFVGYHPTKSSFVFLVQGSVHSREADRFSREISVASSLYFVSRENERYLKRSAGGLAVAFRL